MLMCVMFALLKVHSTAAAVQPHGDRVHAALRHHVCDLPVSARAAPAVLRKGTTALLAKSKLCRNYDGTTF